jgi:Ca2+-binding RTX toxin-like protein
MHPPALAGRRRRTRCALLAAALAAFAIPTAAEAATVSVNPFTPVVGFSAAPGETNQVFVTVSRNKLVFSDITAPITAGDGCTRIGAAVAECPITVDSVIVQLDDGNDRIEYDAPHRASVVAGAGNDTIIGATRSAAPGRSIEPVFYFGGAGSDLITYAFADRGVRVNTDDFSGGGPSEDGRPGIDRETVGDDFERIEGSNFDDPQLFGSTGNDQIVGGNGNDVIGGGGGNDVLLEGLERNGADSLNGGTGNDTVSYGVRASGVQVVLDGLRNDGAPGENDDVRPNVENVQGTSFDDTLVGNSLANTILGFGGVDGIKGGGSNDTLHGGPGKDTIFGEGGIDSIFARDGEFDFGSCGAERGTVVTDSVDSFSGCEDGSSVGTLRLTPQTVQATAGKRTRLRLRWRHPQSWRRLRKIELRLLDDGRPVGEVAIRPRAERIGADGAVELVREHARLTRNGKTVTARLALRLEHSLAGQILKVEVEATDRRGARQLERGAGTVRVAG